jgi:hypothetical protein
MATYTITLTDAEDKALGAVAFSKDEWIQNAVHHRCAVSMEEIVNAEVQRMFAIGQPITGTKEEIVLAASIKSAAERHAEALVREQEQNLSRQR